MNAIRKIVNGNKGFITFWLVLFFLTAGLAKSFANNVPQVRKGDVPHSLSKHTLSSVSQKDSGLSFLDQLKDSDADDILFVFFGNFDEEKLSATFTSEQKFAEFVPQTKIYRVSLYDLYCNWKFHLS